MIFSSIKFDLFEDSFPSCTDHSESINSIIKADCDRRISNSFDTSFLWARRVHKSLSTVLHSDTISDDYSIDSASDHNIVLFTPSQTFYFARMSWEGHSLRIFTSKELEYMQKIAWCCCKILTSVWKFNIVAVFEWIDVFKIAEWLSIFLKVKYPQFIRVSHHQMKTWRMEG